MGPTMESRAIQDKRLEIKKDQSQSITIRLGKDLQNMRVRKNCRRCSAGPKGDDKLNKETDEARNYKMATSPWRPC